MRWQDQRRSENVEDRRGSPRPVMAAGGGLGIIIIALIILFLGGDPQALLKNLPQNPPPGAQPQQQGPKDPAEERLADFMKTVLASTEDVWTEIFRRQQRRPYEEPKLVLFTGQVESACGFASAAVGPFYCPADSKVYLDLQFYSELQNRFKAPGDFAQAYVVAHEIGHHVQNLLGITDKVHQMKGRISEAEYNELSVRLELQADFFAGVWAHHAEKKFRILEEGDVDEGLRAASAIGDDKLQMQARGYVVPESFTHGTSAQRVRWFRRGLESGDMSQGDTFSAREL